MTTEELSVLFGAFVSFVFGSVPYVKPWFDKLEDATKRLVMVGALLAITLAIYGLACAGILNYLIPGAQIACTQEGFWTLIRVFVFAAVGNQTMYTLAYKKSLSEIEE